MMKGKQVLLADDGELAQPESLPEPVYEADVIEPTPHQPIVQHTVSRLIYIGIPAFIGIFALFYFVFLVFYPALALMGLAILLGIYVLYRRIYPTHNKAKRTALDNNFTKMISEAIEHFHHQQPTHFG